jgi:hypothetical protein
MKPVHLFGHALKKAPHDHRFELDGDIRAAALVEWCKQQTKEFFADGIHELMLL